MAGTSISDIMEATKLAKGGVYGNFENKDEICVEVFNYLSKSLSDSINKSFADKKTAKDKLFAILDFYKNSLFKIERGGCPILNFGTEADDTNPAVKQKVREAIERSQKRFANLVNAGIENGEFKKDFIAENFASKALAMIEGSILISRIQNSNQTLILITDMLKKEIEENQI